MINRRPAAKFGQRSGVSLFFSESSSRSNRLARTHLLVNFSPLLARLSWMWRIAFSNEPLNAHNICCHSGNRRRSNAWFNWQSSTSRSSWLFSITVNVSTQSYITIHELHYYYCFFLILIFPCVRGCVLVASIKWVVSPSSAVEVMHDVNCARLAVSLSLLAGQKGRISDCILYPPNC